jgi:hypothetical protein
LTVNITDRRFGYRSAEAIAGAHVIRKRKIVCEKTRHLTLFPGGFHNSVQLSVSLS